MGNDDTRVDAAAMAADADGLGSAAARGVDAVDWLVLASRRGDSAFGTTPARDAFVDCCTTWLRGIDVIAAHTGWAASYTQQVCTAFGSTDTQLAESYAPLRVEDDMPPVVIDQLDPGSENYDPFLA